MPVSLIECTHASRAPSCPYCGTASLGPSHWIAPSRTGRCHRMETLNQHSEKGHRRPPLWTPSTHQNGMQRLLLSCGATTSDTSKSENYQILLFELYCYLSVTMTSFFPPFNCIIPLKMVVSERSACFGVCLISASVYNAQFIMLTLSLVFLIHVHN